MAGRPRLSLKVPEPFWVRLAYLRFPGSRTQDGRGGGLIRQSISLRWPETILPQLFPRVYAARPALP